MSPIEGLRETDTEALAEAATAIVEDLIGDESEWDAAIWKALDQAELLTIALPESGGGGGGSLLDAGEIVRVVGAHAARVPIAEATLLAPWLITQSGLDWPTGVVSASDRSDEVTARPDGADWVLSGIARRVPYARVAAALVLLARAGDELIVVVIDPSEATLRPGANLAGDPYDDVDVTGLRVAYGAVAPAGTAEGLRRRAALGRLLLSAGAAEHVLNLTIRHVQEREQFGRPLGHFQVVQHLVAEMAGEVSALQIGAGSAGRAIESDSPVTPLAVASATIDADRSVTRITAIAHQLHGAIGATHEHSLRRFTLRLWSWRDEAGSATEWADEVGAAILAPGAPPVWAQIVGH